MIRFWWWIEGAPEDRPGGPWWWTDFPSRKEADVHFRTFRRFLHRWAFTETDEGLWIDSLGMKPPREKIEGPDTN